MNARRLSLMHAGLEEVETEPEILPPLALFLPSSEALCVGVGLVALSSIKQHDFSQKWCLTTNLVVAVSKHSWNYAPTNMSYKGAQAETHHHTTTHQSASQGDLPTALVPQLLCTRQV